MHLQIFFKLSKKSTSKCCSQRKNGSDCDTTVDLKIKVWEGQGKLANSSIPFSSIWTWLNKLSHFMSQFAVVILNWIVWSVYGPIFLYL